MTTCQTAGQLRRTLARIAPALQPTSNDGRTGLHFHADRRQLTPWQWHRLTLYCQTMADTLETITGRDCHDYGSLRNVVARDWPTFARFWRSANGPRYVGFNITRHTVEFRACRSSKTTHRLLARFALYRRLIALGRLPDSAKPDANELRGWLAWDPDIRKETGWQPDTWNYRAAARMQPIPSDLPPWERLTPEEQRARQLATLQIRAIEQALRVLNDRSAVVFRQYLRANAAADRHTAAGMARILRARIADSATDQAIWRLQRERNRHQATLDNPEILTQ